MPVKKVTSKKAVKKASGLSVPVYSLIGRAAGNLELPKEIFGAEVNQSLLAQAARVYLNNQKGHFAHTKTRADVKGSTRKVWRQKGTGRARHGSIRAPIWVGGGIALGPKYRKVVLDLPKKMKKQALVSALAQKAVDKQILGVLGLEKAKGKTKEMVSFLKKLNQKSALIVADQNLDNMLRATRNIKNIDFLAVQQVNAYEVMKHQSLILTKEAVGKLQERFQK